MRKYFSLLCGALVHTREASVLVKPKYSVVVIDDKRFERAENKFLVPLTFKSAQEWISKCRIRFENLILIMRTLVFVRSDW